MVSPAEKGNSGGGGDDGGFVCVCVCVFVCVCVCVCVRAVVTEVQFTRHMQTSHTQPPGRSDTHTHTHTHTHRGCFECTAVWGTGGPE